MQESRAALLVVVTGTLMAAVDSTIMILALPTVGQALDSNLSTIIWAILIYFLLTAVLTTQMGRIGDIFGRSRFYNAGFAVFTLGSFLCGISPNDLALIGFRGVQAVGGAMILANGGAVISDHFPADRRGYAFGYTTFGWSVGAVLGILLGGVITTFFDWRYIFFINVPIGIFAVLVGYHYLKDREKTGATLDLPGFALLTVALSLSSYGAIEMASIGVTPEYLGVTMVGVLILVPFLWWEARAPSPTIDLTYFRDRLMSFSLLSAFLQGIGYLSIVFLLTMYLQGILGMSPLDSSLLLVPGYVVSGLFSPYMGRFADSIGARFMATAGIIIMVVGVLAYSTFTVSTNPYWVIPVSLLTGFGGAMYWPANNSAIMKQARRGSFGSISGLRSTLTGVGSLLSFVVTIAISGLSVPRDVAFAIFLGTTNLRGFPPSVAAAFLNGIHAALIVSGIILGVAAVVSYARPHDGPQRPRDDTSRGNAMPTTMSK